MPLNYIERIREYYQALGYGAPYQWAHFDDVPFTPLKKPLAESVVGIVTTAAPYRANSGDQGPGAAYNGSAKFFSVYSDVTSREPDLRISHIGYDRAHTTAEDQASYFPLRALKALAEDGKIKNIASRFHGLPTNRSQKTTIEVDSAKLVSRCRQDAIDAAVLVPNCPVCHQSVSLAARALEAAGIATVIMGCARDIVEYVGVPRLLFNNFPLGNAAGLPNDPDSQLRIASQALDLLAKATAPRTTEQSPFSWSGARDWQRDYSNAAILSKQEIARRREEFDRVKVDAKRVRAAEG
ncbi:MAG: glycine/sarcosine/betaine reductase selenoprotein B family protein [Gammaproteobacteria bacterium]|nr:glycine/sarcosine/betaine reductase selenoprotein B family protein [Gammaproteobacteria bacterium]